uniref:AGRL2-4 GAIN subdomain A domain-containing protein n=1 Tax=Prolemur simus TaxID=1328070 RepID=A0A8C9DKV4_PROSS
PQGPWRTVRPYRAPVGPSRPHGAPRLSIVRLSDQDVVLSGSALLAPATRAAWEQIQRSEGGAAQLLRHFEAYFGNMARNVRRTYLRPFVIVTTNMSKGRGSSGAGGTLGPSGGCGHRSWPVCSQGRWATGRCSATVLEN